MGQSDRRRDLRCRLAGRAGAAAIRTRCSRAPRRSSRLAGTLPQGGAPRLERLRGFGAGIGGTLLCLCSRLTLADNSRAILVVATERAGKDFSLPERARRLLADIEQPAAIFQRRRRIDRQPSPARARASATSTIWSRSAPKSWRARPASTATPKARSRPADVTMLRLGAGATVALLRHVRTGARRHANRCASRAGKPIPQPDMRAATSLPDAGLSAAAPTQRRRSLPLRLADGCRDRASPTASKISPWSVGPKTAAHARTAPGPRLPTRSARQPAAPSPARWPRTGPGAALSCNGRSTTATRASRSKCRRCRCSTATGNSPAIAVSRSAATSSNWPRSSAG